MLNLRKLISRFFVPPFYVSLHYYIKFGCKISYRAEVELSPLLRFGEKTNIGSFVKIKATDGPLTVGRNVSISNGTTILAGEKGIKIGDDCLIGSNVVIVGNNYRYDDIKQPIYLQGQTSKGVTIGNNVWIGVGAVILDGSNIGNGVIITPNSVVMSQVPDNSIVQGNPAKVIFTRR